MFMFTGITPEKTKDDRFLLLGRVPYIVKFKIGNEEHVIRCVFRDATSDKARLALAKKIAFRQYEEYKELHKK